MFVIVYIVWLVIAKTTNNADLTKKYLHFCVGVCMCDFCYTDTRSLYQLRIYIVHVHHTYKCFSVRECLRVQFIYCLINFLVNVRASCKSSKALCTYIRSHFLLRLQSGKWEPPASTYPLNLIAPIRKAVLWEHSSVCSGKILSIIFKYCNESIIEAKPPHSEFYRQHLILYLVIGFFLN